MSKRSIFRVRNNFPATFNVLIISAMTLFFGSSERVELSRRLSTNDRQIININTTKPIADTMENTTNNGIRV
jgi:hypothetical protein